MTPLKIIICDTSVLINFLKIERIALFEKCSYDFYIADHVQEEITIHYNDQCNLLDDALQKGTLSKVSVEDPRELHLFGELSKSGLLGAGECAAISVAYHREWLLAIDDKQAIKKTESLLLPERILRTHQLFILMIQEQLLDVDEAESLIETLATKHRFRLKNESLRDFIGLTYP